MNCPKCSGRNVYATGVGEDRSGYSWVTWVCLDCGHEYSTRRYTAERNVSKKSKSVTTELPDEIVINGIRYRKVDND